MRCNAMNGIESHEFKRKDGKTTFKLSSTGDLLLTHEDISRINMILNPQEGTAVFEIDKVDPEVERAMGDARFLGLEDQRVILMAFLHSRLYQSDFSGNIMEGIPAIDKCKVLHDIKHVDHVKRLFPGWQKWTEIPRESIFRDYGRRMKHRYLRKAYQLFEDMRAENLNLSINNKTMKHRSWVKLHAPPMFAFNKPILLATIFGEHHSTATSNAIYSYVHLAALFPQTLDAVKMPRRRERAMIEPGKQPAWMPPEGEVSESYYNTIDTLIDETDSYTTPTEVMKKIPFEKALEHAINKGYFDDIENSSDKDDHFWDAILNAVDDIAFEHDCKTALEEEKIFPTSHRYGYGV